MADHDGVVKIAPEDAEAASLWSDFGRLASQVLPAGWTLVGGLMVQLHAYEAGETDVRVRGSEAPVMLIRGWGTIAPKMR